MNEPNTDEINSDNKQSEDSNIEIKKLRIDYDLKKKELYFSIARWICVIIGAIFAFIMKDYRQLNHAMEMSKLQYQHELLKTYLQVSGSIKLVMKIG